MTMLRRAAVVALLIALTALAAACGTDDLVAPGPAPADVGADGAADAAAAVPDGSADAEIDAEVPADASADAEIDAEAPADASADADIDAEAPADASADTEIDAEVPADGFADAEIDAEVPADGFADTEIDAEVPPDASADSAGDAEVPADGSADSDGLGEVSPDALSDPDSADATPIDAGPACPWPPDPPCLFLGVCAAGVPIACAAGQGECAYAGLPDYEEIELTCDGLDNDCNGDVDDLLPAPAAQLQAGVCKGNLQVCAGAAGWQEPDYALLPGYEATETGCDGVDNDCDGQTDEMAPLPADPSLGVCAGAVQTCQGAAGWQAPNLYAIDGYAPGPELGCDHLDNDCDGQTDEDLPCPLWQVGGRGPGRLALAPDGQHLAWLSLTGVHVLQTATGEPAYAHLGHGYEVTDVDWAPDGTRLASTGRFDALRVYLPSAATPAYAQAPEIAVHQFGTTYGAVAYSPNGSRIATADQGGLVRLYATWSGQVAKLLVGHEAKVQALAWVQGGPWLEVHLASGDDAGHVFLWHTVAATKAKLASLPGPIRSLAAQPGTSRLLVVAQGEAPRVYDTDTGKLEAVLAGHQAPVVGGGWLAATGEALTVDVQGEVRRWLVPGKPAPGKPLSALQVVPGPKLDVGDGAADLAARAGQVAIGFVLSGPRRLDLATGTWTPLGLRHQGAVRRLAAATGVLASAGDDAVLRLWTGHGKPLLAVAGHEGAITALDLHAAGLGAGILGGGALLVSGSNDFTLRLWQVAPGAKGVVNLKTLGLGGPWPEDAAYAPGVPPEQLWAAAGGTAFLLAAGGANAGQQLGGHATGFGNTIESVRPSPDGGRVLLGMSGTGPGGGVHYRQLDAKTLQVLWQIKGLPAERHVAAWHPDGKLLAVGGGDAYLALLDADTGTVLAPLYGHLGPVTSVQFGAGGTRLLSTSADGTARLWQVAAGQPTVSLGVWTRHCPAPCTLVSVEAGVFLDAAGQQCATAGSDGAVMGWKGL